MRKAQDQRCADPREAGAEQVQVSICSHKPEVHDAIAKLPGSLARSLKGIRLMRAAGLKATLGSLDFSLYSVGDYRTTTFCGT